METTFLLETGEYITQEECYKIYYETKRSTYNFDLHIILSYKGLLLAYTSMIKHRTSFLFKNN